MRRRERPRKLPAMGLDRVRIVLVRPKIPENVGAAARAMKNMGLRDLVLVAPRRFRRKPAEAMAVHAADVLEGMRVVRTIDEAVADCGWVVATTAKRGPYRGRASGPREAATEILRVATKNRVAILFGPEDTGLVNEDLEAANEIVAIPAHVDYPSLNLAQAVLLVAWELRSADRPVAEQPELASAAEVDRMIDRLEHALTVSGYLPESNPAHLMFAIRRIFGRARLDERDVRIWLGVARHIEWLARGGGDIVATKRARGERLK